MLELEVTFAQPTFLLVEFDNFNNPASVRDY